MINEGNVRLRGGGVAYVKIGVCNASFKNVAVRKA